MVLIAANGVIKIVNGSFRLMLMNLVVQAIKYSARLGTTVPASIRVSASLTSNQNEIKLGSAPSSVNWGDYCAITPIKN